MDDVVRTCLCLCVLYVIVSAFVELFACVYVCTYMHGHVFVYPSIPLYVTVFCNVGSKRHAEEDMGDGAKRVSAGKLINSIFICCE